MEYSRSNKVKLSTSLNKKFNIVILILIVLSGISNAYAQGIMSTKDSIKFYVDTVFNIIQEHSLFVDKIDWKNYKNQLMRRALENDRFNDILPLFQQVFDSLNDKHSFISYANKEYRSQKNRRDISTIRKSLINALRKGNLKIATSIIHSRYGYILIPFNRIFNNDLAVDSLAQQIQDSLCKLNNKKIHGWIIDLRLNTGGNMSPMIAGLQNLIGEGIFVNWLGKEGNIQESSSIKNGKILFGNTTIAFLTNICRLQNDSNKIAILISQVTSSSGELTALAFKGRKNIKFIGEKTAGFMTANKAFFLPFDSYMLLAVNYEADRNNQKYDFIEPDIYTAEEDNFENPEKDIKIMEAIRWMEKQ